MKIHNSSSLDKYRLILTDGKTSHQNVMISFMMNYQINDIRDKESLWVTHVLSSKSSSNLSDKDLQLSDVPSSKSNSRSKVTSKKSTSKVKTNSFLTVDKKISS